MKITALQAFHYRGTEARPGDVLEVSDELGIEWTRKGLARISARDLTRILRSDGERNRTTPASSAPITMHRRG